MVRRDGRQSKIAMEFAVGEVATSRGQLLVAQRLGHRSSSVWGGSRLAHADLVEVATEVGRVVVDPVRAGAF
jgi:hypothetical protein